MRSWNFSNPRDVFKTALDEVDQIHKNLRQRLNINKGRDQSVGTQYTNKGVKSYHNKQRNKQSGG